MKTKDTYLFTAFAALIVLALFAVTQVEFYLISREPRPQPAAVANEEKTPVRKPPATEMEPPASRDMFDTVGSSIIQRHEDGATETLIPDFSEVMETGIGGGIDIIAHPEKDTVVLAASCWEGNSLRPLYALNTVSKTVTKMRSVVPCRYDVEPEQGVLPSTYLIYPGPDGDRFIWVDLLKDTSKEVAILPAPYTYIQNLDESGYSDFVIGKVDWGYGFEAEVFDGRTPLDFLDYRLPVMMKLITPN